ncbi:MAG: T9SS type A sorting domain-containing protein [Flavobacteriales bacterium]|nr:T9SS type A sorting domain-containing protein [Flavobacteriales bacterium]
MKNTLLIILIFISSMLLAQTKVSVTASGGSFTSANITINIGDTVEWTNVGGTHNVNGTQATFASNPASFGNAIGSGWTYSFVFTIAGTYNYQCDVHAPNMTGTVTVQMPTGVEDQIVTENIGFYPNPALNDLFFTGYESIANVAIYSLTGEKVLESKLVVNKIDISMLSSGLYFVKLTTEEGDVTKKLIVE